MTKANAGLGSFGEVLIAAGAVQARRQERSSRVAESDAMLDAAFAWVRRELPDLVADGLEQFAVGAAMTLRMIQVAGGPRVTGQGVRDRLVATGRMEPAASVHSKALYGDANGLRGHTEGLA